LHNVNPPAEYIPKKKRPRRIKLDDLDDTRRESRRNYVALVNGTLSLEQAEIRGRALSRHREILAAAATQNQLAALIVELQGLRGQGAIAFNPDLLEPET
jgi:hypothetical protein